VGVPRRCSSGKSRGRVEPAWLPPRLHPGRELHAPIRVVWRPLPVISPTTIGRDHRPISPCITPIAGGEKSPHRPVKSTGYQTGFDLQQRLTTSVTRGSSLGDRLLRKAGARPKLGPGSGSTPVLCIFRYGPRIVHMLPRCLTCHSLSPCMEQPVTSWIGKQLANDTGRRAGNARCLGSARLGCLSSVRWWGA